MKIRKAEIEDALGIAEINIEVWRTTYKGIMPDEDLDNLSCENRTQFYLKFFENKENDSFVYVAEDKIQGVCGYLIGGRAEENAYDCEIHAIYILEEFQRKGIGSLLFKTAIDEFRKLSLNSLIIWALKDNPYKAFYRKLGGKQVGNKSLKGLIS